MIARRTLLGTALAAPAAALSPPRPKVVVVGGGFAGATAARALAAQHLDVTLLEPEAEYLACPFSNAVIVGLREMAGQRFTLAKLEKAGVTIRRQAARAVEDGRVVLADGTALPFDRVVIAPGIEVQLDTLPGYDAAAAEALPHAWKAGPQTLLLRRQLEAMPDGGTVLMSVPANPYRCPPGPYERASLIAWWLKRNRPRSKLLVLDAKDAFSKQRLFQQAWQALYPGVLEYVPLSDGGKVTEVDARGRALVTEFGRHEGQVVNVIPPQRAGAIAQQAGVADRSGWCPIDPATFESRLRPRIHVIGDAAIAGAMPKSAFAANAQAKACAIAVAALIRGEAAPEPRLVNTCYSLVAPGYGISIAGVYRPANGLLADVEGAGGTSPLNVPPEFRAAEARYAEDWYATITAEVFG